MKQKKIGKQLAKKYGRDVRVIEQITKHPFKFLYELMKDPNEYRPFRIPYFGVFVQKDRSNKKKYYSDVKTKKILRYED